MTLPVAYSPVRVRIDRDLEEHLIHIARHRPVVIDHYASRRCGATIGDLRVRVEDPPPGAEVVELEPIGSVRILAEPSLLQLLANGAELRIGTFPWPGRLSIDLDHPASWLDFLEEHPASRR